MSAKLSKDMADFAKYLAMAVRNEMEDFHCKYLSDEQMRELNPLIRNAIATALYAAQQQDRSESAKLFVAFTAKSIPDYWEEPVLTADYLALQAQTRRRTRKKAA